MILMIDNYDSFTYNLVQYFGELGADLHVVRNDAITIDQIKAMDPRAIVISPGPGSPRDSKICPDVIRHFSMAKPILGVCLGHQTLGWVFGAQVTRAPKPVHGKRSKIYHTGEGVFRGLPSPFLAARYHSLVVEPESLPPQFVPTAWTDDEVLMGIRHRELPLEGIQFHPESIVTEHGKELLSNFLKMLPIKGRLK